MPELVITSIIDGDGEVAALPVLLRRIAGETMGIWDSDFPLQRQGRNNIVAPGGIEGFVEIAAIRAQKNAAILVLIDADDDCPADLAPSLLARARHARPDRPISVVLVDQAALTAMFDIALARRNSPSFDKFCRDVEHLIIAALG